MRRILLTVAACALGLTMTTSTAEAHPPRYGHPTVYYRTHGAHYPGGYYRDHGVRFTGGYYYTGRNHHHWSYKVWDDGCHRYQYYDPSLRCYYYWNTARGCYYPVGY
jgi:hypothetical protein